MTITMKNLSAGILPANIQTLVNAAQETQVSTDVVNLTGDVAGSADISAVTYAKMQNVSAGKLLGNPTGSAAAPTGTTYFRRIGSVLTDGS
jgi:hypothetical protein